MAQNVAAIVVTYNRKDLLLENIECLLNQKPIVPTIVIIDNHSNDGTGEALKQYIADERIIYCDTGANLGGAGGFSYGIRYAAEHGYDYVWVMDDDCMPKDDALSAFLTADKKLNGEYGFLSSKVLWKDGSICTMNVQRKTITRKVMSFGKEIQPVVMASFVSLFLPRHIIMEMGLPIKDFFIWTDDWEYTRRISRKYKSYVVPDSVVIHKSKSNIGANIVTESEDRLDRFDYLYRNDVYLYRREGIKGFLYETARLSGHCLKVIFKSTDNRSKRLQKIIMGTIRGLSFRPEIEYAERQRMKEPDNTEL